MSEAGRGNPGHRRRGARVGATEPATGIEGTVG